MRLKPAIRYQLHEVWVGGFVFFLVNVGFVALCFLGLLKVQGLDGEGFAFSWYDFSCAIYFFLFGLILPRQAARLCVQMGVSRRTAYLSFFLSALPAALAMAVAGQVLLAGSNLAAEQVAPALEGRFLDLFSLVKAKAELELKRLKSNGALIPDDLYLYVGGSAFVVAEAIEALKPRHRLS